MPDSYIALGPDDAVATTADPDQAQSTVTWLADGEHYVVVWTTNNGSDQDVLGRIFEADGTPVGDDFLIGPDAGQTFAPQIAPLSNGGFVVVWVSDSNQAFGQVFNGSGGTVGAVFEVEPAGVGAIAIELSVAGYASGGGFIVSWTEVDGGSPLIFAQSFDATGGALLSPVQVSVDDTEGQIASSVAALADGSTVVVWEDENEVGGSEIRMAVYMPNGTRVTMSDVLVNSTTAGSQITPSVAALVGGGYVVAWTDGSGDTDGFAIRAQVFSSSGAPVGDEFLVNSTITGSQNDPHIAGLPDGGFVISWTDPGSGDGDIRARRFDAAGEPLGDDFVVGSTPADLEAESAVAVSPIDGSLVVTWSAYGPSQSPPVVIEQRLFELSAANTAPSADDVSGNGSEDGARVAIVLTADDAEDAIDHFTITTGPANGTLYDALTGGTALTYPATIAASGDQATVYFQPNADWNGDTDFSYTASDGTLDSDPATASISIGAENDAADITGDSAGDVTEAGGVANGAPGTPSDSGDLDFTDVDNDADVWQAVAPGGATANLYGSYALTAAGVWTYTLDNDNAAVQALNVGGTLTDSFTALTEDGTGQLVTVTIHGANDAAILSTDVRDLTETNAAVDISASGTLTNDDIDDPETFVAQTDTDGLYGTFSIDTAGAWTYTADNAHDEFVLNQIYTDIFTVAAADGTETTVTINVTGTNDAADITGDSAGDVTEAGGVANGAPGTPSDSGDLDFTDVDNDADVWQAVAPGGATANLYGSYALTAAGVWTYTIDNDDAAVQALNVGGTLTDSFTALTEDGTGQLVTVTIHGANDAAIVSADVRDLTETNAAVDISASGTLTNDDIDDPETFVAQTDVAGTYGTFSLLSSGAWTYTASSAHNEFAVGVVYTDTFPVASADGTATSVTINITGTNDAAIVSADVRDLTETNAAVDISASGTLTNDDPDSPETFVAQTDVVGTYGTFSLLSSGAWTYTASSAHNEFAVGVVYTDSFAVAAADGTVTSVTINITGTNDAAIVSADVRDLTETNSAVDISATGTLTISDVDSSAAFVPQTNVAGSYGTFSINAGGAWTYTASSAHNEFVGGTGYTDAFTVAAADGTTTSVTINILGTNDAAIVSADVRDLTETNSAVDISASGTLTISDVDSSAAFVPQTNVAGSYGTFSISAGGAWTYTASSAHNEFVGGTGYTDAFTVAAADGTTTSVTINILGTNDAAIVSADVRDLSETNSAVDISATGTLTISDVDSSATFVPQTDAAGSYGTFSINASGAWTYTAASAHNEFVAGVVYTDTFPVASADGTTTSVTINITGTNDAPTVTPSGGATAFVEGADTPSTPVVIDSALVLADVDDTAFDSAMIFFNGSYVAGEDSFGFTANAGLYGDIAISSNADGVLELTSASGTATVAQWQAALRSVTYLNSSDTPTESARYVSFNVYDGATFNANLFSKEVTVTAANDSAVITGDAAGAVTEAGGVANGTPGAPTDSGNLNFTDVDNDDDVWQAVAPGGATASLYGSYALTAAGVWTYTLNNSNAAVQALNVGGTLTDSFTALTEDGTGQLVTVTIHGANDAAILSTDVRDLTETNSAVDISASGTLTITDVDSSATFVAQTDVAGTYGTFSLLSSGAWTYTASSAHNEFVVGVVYTDSFPVAAADGTATSVTINITGTNDAPVNTTPASYSVDEDTGLVLTGLSVGDVDAGSDEITVHLSVAHGTLNIRTDVAGGIAMADITGGGQGTNGITLTATIAQINATLAAANGLTYQGDPNFNGGDALTISTFDGIASDPLSFTAEAVSPALTNATCLVTGDVDGDDILDLVYIGDVSHLIGIRLGNGDGTFGATSTLATGGEPSAVILVDIDADNDLDLVSANFTEDGSAGDGVGVRLNDGIGNFGAYQDIATSLPAAYDVSAADVDGDGRVDLIVARRDFGMVSVLLASGPAGSFAAPVEYSATADFLLTQAILLGDFTGDGRADIICMNYGHRTTGAPPGTVTMLVNNGDGTFAAPVDLATSLPSPHDAGAADLDGDGDLDLVFTTITGAEGLTVMLGNGDGTFQAGTYYATTGDAVGVTIGDVNGDGRPDLITGSGTGSIVAVFLGNGDGSFQPRVALDTSSYFAGHAVIGDFDGDGDNDVALDRGISDGQGVFLNLNPNRGDADVVPITVNPVNDEPALAATAANPTYIEDAAAADLFSAVTASTVESGQSFTSLTLTVTNVTDGASEILSVGGTDVALTDGNIVAIGGLTATVALASGIATVTVTGTQTAAELQILVDGLAYRNASQNPTDADRVVTLTQVVDSGLNSAPDDATTTLNIASTVDVVPVNDPPTIDNLHGDSPTYTEDAMDEVLLDEGTLAMLADVDSPNFNGGTLIVSIGVGRVSSRDALYFSNTGGVDTSGGILSVGGFAIGTVSGGDYTSGEGALTVIFNTDDATIARIETALRALTYGNGSQNPIAGTRNIAITLTDGDGGAQSVTVNTTVDVVALNDAPSGIDHSLTFVEDVTHVFTLADFSYSDTEGHALLSVTITTLPAPGTGTLYYDADGPDPGAPAPVTAGQVISAADIAAGLLSFVPATDDNGTARATFTYQVQDVGGVLNGGVDFDGSANTISIDLTAVNDAPTVTITPPGTYAVNEQTALDLKGTIAVADLDAAEDDGDIIVTLSVGYGRLDVTAGTSGAGVANSGTSIVTITGTLAEIQALLGGDATSIVTYTPHTDHPPTSTILTVTVDDDGNSGISGPLTATDTETIAITQINDAPSGTGNILNVAENTPRVLNPADFAFTDPEGHGFAAVTIVTLPNQGGIYYDADGPGGSTFVPTLITAGTTFTAAQLVGARLTYRPDQDESGNNYTSFTYIVRDNGGTDHGGLDTDPDADTITINVGGFNNAPSADNLGNDFVTYLEDSPAGTVWLDDGRDAVITDFDSADFDGGIFSVRIVVGEAAAEDELVLVTGTNGVTMVGDEVFVDGVSIGTVTAAGIGEDRLFTLNSGANAATITRLIHNFSFVNHDTATPTEGQRLIEFRVSDGDGASMFVYTTVNVVAVDDPGTAGDDSGLTDEATAITLSVLANDDDIDGPAPSIAEVNGAPIIVGTPITLPSGALLTLNNDGTFTYNPDPGLAPTPAPGSGASNTPAVDVFTYTLAAGGTGTVTVTVTGIDTNDFLTGSAGADSLDGGIGNDRVEAGAGIDGLLGGDGDDHLDGGTEGDFLFGQEGDDTLVGGGGDDRLEGGAGVDGALGGAGADYIDGGAESDYLFGEDGDDTILGDGGADRIDGGAGIDGILGGAGADFIAGGIEGDYLFGEDGDDTILGEDGDDRIDGGAGTDGVLGGAGADYITGGSELDYLFGEGGGDTIVGDDGDDVLDGGDGDDGLTGGAGADRLIGGAGVDFGLGGAGADFIVGGLGNDTLFGQDDGDTILGEDGDDRLEGGAGADGILGGIGADYVDGGADGDFLFGEDGIDTILGGGGNDYVDGGGGNDGLLGGAGDDFVDGGAGRDVLYGEDGDDTLLGGVGDDVLYGGAGNDGLVGGGGADLFVFSTALGAGNVDVIDDFFGVSVDGEDLILLDHNVFAGLSTGTLSASAFVVGTAAEDADDRIIYDNNSGALYFDADGNGEGAAVQFATLSQSPGLTASDFTVI